jgi:hypothetical protein
MNHQVRKPCCRDPKEKEYTFIALFSTSQTFTVGELTNVMCYGDMKPTIE